MRKYTIGLITGALLAISAMMFMGARDSERGKYQAFASEGRRYLLDTQSAKLYSYNINSDNGWVLRSDGF